MSPQDQENEMKEHLETFCEELSKQAKEKLKLENIDCKKEEIKGMLNYFEIIFDEMHNSLKTNEVLMKIRLLSKNVIEDAKKELSSNTETTIDLKEIFGNAFDSETIQITREEFEQQCANDKLFEKMEKVFDEIIERKPIVRKTHVYVVGGTSNIPKIRESIQEKFEGAEIHFDEDSMITAVVNGTTRYSKQSMDSCTAMDKFTSLLSPIKLQYQLGSNDDEKSITLFEPITDTSQKSWNKQHSFKFSQINQTLNFSFQIEQGKNVLFSSGFDISCECQIKGTFELNDSGYLKIKFEKNENEIIIEQNIRILMYNVSDEEYKGRIKEFK